MTRPHHRLLDPHTYRVMPWKNGGGTTTELIIEPDGAGLDTGFHWRLSMAEVSTSGPFSRFDGYDRTLLLLEGRGMRLDMEGHGTIDLKKLLAPIRFSGDWITSGTLLDGPCRDFNIITRRERCEHHLEVHRLGSSSVTLPDADICFLFCVSGRLRVEPAGLVLAPMQLLRLEANPERIRVTGDPEATLIAIDIHLHPMP